MDELILTIIWKNDKGRRCTSFIEAPEVTGEIIEITHHLKSELDKLTDLGIDSQGN